MHVTCISAAQTTQNWLLGLVTASQHTDNEHMQGASRAFGGNRPNDAPKTPQQLWSDVGVDLGGNVQLPMIARPDDGAQGDISGGRGGDGGGETWAQAANKSADLQDLADFFHASSTPPSPPLTTHPLVAQV